MMPPQYAVYRGDDLVCIGTASKCAQASGVKRETIAWQSTPAAKRRLAARRHPERCLTVDRI